ncbi:MAG: hypothetical protein PHV68_07525 [Candidatus Gastranaerophilales bacterium]|nr:hypothetical protein [Candidatus Gastranaerophilales bacterium]
MKTVGKIARGEGELQKEKLKKIFKIAKKGIFYFILINIIMYSIVITKQSINRPFPLAKVFFSASFVTNIVYVIPSLKTFGINNILSKPVVYLRDKLYEFGANNTSDNDAEKHIWWCRIYLTEYHWVVESAMANYIEGKNDIDPNLFIDWTDDIYKHYEPLAKLPIKDKQNDYIRLNYLKKMAWGYLSRKSIYNYINLKGYKTNSYENFFYNIPFVKDKKEISRVKKILDLYLGARKKYPTNYFLINEPKTWYSDPSTIHQLSLYMVSSLILEDKPLCENYVTELFITSDYILKNKALNDPNIPAKYKKSVIRKIIDNKMSNFVIEKIGNKCYDNKGE